MHGGAARLTRQVADSIRSGTFGDANVFSALLDTVFGSGRDYYVRCQAAER